MANINQCNEKASCALDDGDETCKKSKNEKRCKFIEGISRTIFDNDDVNKIKRMKGRERKIERQQNLRKKRSRNRKKEKKAVARKGRNGTERC